MRERTIEHKRTPFIRGYQKICKKTIQNISEKGSVETKRNNTTDAGVPALDCELSRLIHPHQTPDEELIKPSHFELEPLLLTSANGSNKKM